MRSIANSYYSSHKANMKMIQINLDEQKLNEDGVWQHENTDGNQYTFTSTQYEIRNPYTHMKSQSVTLSYNKGDEFIFVKSPANVYIVFILNENNEIQGVYDPQSPLMKRYQ